MSKNKRRESRNNSVETAIAEPLGKRADAGQTVGATNSNQTLRADKASWFSYFKEPSHWWVIGLIALLTLGATGASLKYLEEDAQRQKAARANQSPLANQPNESLLNSVNPFVEPPPPTPTPQLSKEYLYAGSRLLAVEDANANAAPPADLAVWRPSTGTWYVFGGQGSQQTAFTWGGSGDTPVPGDYDGDGKTDFSVFRPSTGYWYVSNSSNGNTTESYFGASTDKPAQADYDGDGKTDKAVFRPSTGYWYITKSSDGSTLSQAFGLSTDTPTPADFDGDGKADIAVWRNSNATFYILRSSDGMVQSIQFGHTGDTPVVGDFDGDGKADAGVWRPTTAPNNEGYQWQIRYSSNQSYQAYTMGDPATDIAVQNDYDGDGRVDVAIWRPSNGTWYIVQSHDNSNRIVQWGQNFDVPVPAFYRR